MSTVKLNNLETLTKIDFKNFIVHVDALTIFIVPYTLLPLMYLHQFKFRWNGLQGLVQVESQRQIKGGTFSQKKSYYISILLTDAALIANAIRAHWRIENNLH